MVARRALPVPPRRCAPYSAILPTRSVCVVGSRGAIPALYGRYERGGARAAGWLRGGVRRRLLVVNSKWVNFAGTAPLATCLPCLSTPASMAGRLAALGRHLRPAESQAPQIGF